MQSTQWLLKSVLERIRPTPAEHKENKRVATLIINRLKKEGYSAVIVGSRARNTFISGDRDLDIFFFFPVSVGRKELEKRGVAIGKRVLRGYNPETHYAEHPYVRGVVDGLMVEVVPCYRMKKRIISAVDRSPLHNKFVKKQLKKKQRDDVILLKQFMKAVGVYGADQKTHGFSGYLCELLVIKHKSFRGVIMAAGKWKLGVTIDMLKLRKDYSKFDAPLIVVDPVDAERNVAAAVNVASFLRFQNAARGFLKIPSENFFFPKKKVVDVERWLKDKNAILISMACPKVVEEILWSQLERLASGLERQLRVFDFEVTGKRHWTDEKQKCGILLEVKSLRLQATMVQHGPLVKDKKNYSAFVKKHRSHWTSKGRVHANVKRKYTDTTKLAKDVLRSKSVPSHFRVPGKKAKILTNRDTLKEQQLMEGILSRE